MNQPPINHKRFRGSNFYLTTVLIFFTGLVLGILTTGILTKNNKDTTPNKNYVDFTGIIVSKNKYKNKQLSCIRVHVKEINKSSITDTSGVFSFTIDKNEHSTITYFIEDIHKNYTELEETIELIESEKPVEIRLDTKHHYSKL